MSHDNKMAEGESEKNDQKQEENSVSHDPVDELQEIENMVLNPNINVENLVEEASNGTAIYNILYFTGLFFRSSLAKLGLVHMYSRT